MSRQRFIRPGIEPGLRKFRGRDDRHGVRARPLCG